MSKYSKSKRSQSGAGNHFDKLIKVCSNSKVTGTIGRFGVASFTSIRSTATEPPVEEKKPKSKYASFKKRARLDPTANKPPPPVDTGGYATLLPLTPTTSTSALTPSTTMLKPRKFFKSRGPMEVEVGPNQVSTKPFRPEVSNLVALLPPLPNPSMSPLIPSNINTNSQYYDQNTSHDHHKHKHKNNKKQKSKKLENSFAPLPSKQQSSDSSFSSVCSPPIKLRIFKDRGKFVAETAVDAPSETAPPIIKGSGKRGRKPGSRNKKSPDTLSFEEQKPPPKKARRGKNAAPTMDAPPKAASGRTTRNSTRRLASDSDSGMPSLDREMRNSISSLDGLDNTGDNMYPQPATLMVGTCELNLPPQPPTEIIQSGEIIKKLEEDADFKKLSEMLSSMENDAGTGSAINSYSQPNQHQNQHFDNIHQDFQGHPQQLEHNMTNYDNMESGSSSVPPPRISAFAAQAYIQQQFRQQMQQHGEDMLQTQHMSPNEDMHQQPEPTQHYYNDDNMDMGYQTQQQQSHQQMSSGLPQQESLPKANDIRSILVDDWTDFDDDQHSPRKPPSQSQSPAKFSRFDMSAFMPKDEAPEQSYPPVHHDQAPRDPDPEPHHQDINRQMEYPSTGSGDVDQHQQLPYNIHSSPYSMRNLLNCPPGGMPEGQFEGDPQQAHFQQQSLHFPPVCVDQVPLNSLSTCAKQEAISILDSVLKQQQMSNDVGPPSSLTSALNNLVQKQQAPSTRKASIFKSRANQAPNGESSGVSGGNGNGKTSSKRLALYKHKFGQEDNTEEKVNKNEGVPQGSILAEFDDEFGEEFEDHELMLTKEKVESGGYSSQWNSEVTKVTCHKKVKRLFTVVKNVKAVHELQESGEFHEFDGDIQYILEDLRNKNPMNIRCLSAITLATRCMEPSFRMHLRAHGTVAEFCRELHDSPQHPELALLAALVLFVLSQDRLNMDLDTDTLKLILALSKAEDCSGGEQTQSSGSQSQNDNLENLKHHQKVLDLCVEMKDRGHATHLKLDRITASELALETLLHLTSKRAGEWVKHELRALGGLDSIVNEVDSCLRFVQIEMLQCGWTEGVIERLRKIDRCLQVLQQVTFNHEHNQKYLLGMSEREIQYANGETSVAKCVETSPKIFVELFRFCKDNLQQSHMELESAGVMREILFSVLRVLVNLSHDYRGIVLGSEILLAMDGFLQLVLHSTFEMGRYFPDEKIFDLLMHSLCMLLNLVEHSRNCRNAILKSTVQKSSAGNYRVPDSCGNTSINSSSDDSGVDEEIPVLDAFVEMFLCRERAAKKEEQHTDNILTKGPDSKPPHEDTPNSEEKEGSTGGASQGGSGPDKNSQDSEGSSLQDTIDKLIQTAGKHMENSLIAAYISLLLAYLIMDSPMAANQVRNSMPNGQFLPLMIFLKKLFNFMSITSSASGSIRGLKATAIALRFFAQQDPRSDEELKKLIPD